MILFVLFLLLLLLSTLLMNNLLPSLSLKHCRYHIVPIMIILSSLLGIFVSKLLIADPDAVASATFYWLQAKNTFFSVKFTLNNLSLFSGVFMALLFLFQIIILLLSPNQKHQSPMEIIHQLNIIYILMLISFIILFSDNYLICFIGMIFLSGAGIYQSLFIGKGPATKHLTSFFLADFIFIVTIFIVYQNSLTFTISGTESAIMLNVGKWIALLQISAIIIKIMAFHNLLNHSDSGTFYNDLLFLEILTIFMFLLVRLYSTLSDFTVHVIMIAGLLMMMIPAILSLFKSGDRAIFRHLLLSQFGLFIVILSHCQLFIITLYIFSFLFSNLLLFFVHINFPGQNKFDNRGFSIFKSGYFWLLLLAVFYIAGLLPGSGFIPKINLISHLFTSSVSTSAVWIQLVFIGLGLLLLSIAVFRYFFLILQRRKEPQPTITVPNLIIGFTVFLNLYLFFTLPNFDPFAQTGWFYRIIPSTYLSPVYDNFNIANALGIILSPAILGFLVALLTYQFNVFPSTILNKLFRPVNTIAKTIIQSVSTSYEWINENISTMGNFIRKIEASTIRQSQMYFKNILKWLSAMIVTTDRRLTHPKMPAKFIKRLEMIIHQPCEKYEMLIPGILIITLIIIIFSSII